jgi:hypothetical protein
MSLFASIPRLALALLTAGVIAPSPAGATDALKCIEQALAAAQADKKGVTLYVQGQQIGGGVVRIEPGQIATLTVTLPPIPPAPPPAPPPALPPVATLPAPPLRGRAPRPRWRIVAGGTTLFFGLTLTAVGGLVFAINQSNLCPPAAPPALPPPGCEASTLATQYNLGVSLMPVGAALALTGIGLLAVPGPRPAVATPSLRAE